MKITRVEPILLSVPIGSGGFSWSGGAISILDTCLIRVHSDCGMYGVGDAYGLGCFAAEIGESIFNWFGNKIVGKELKSVTSMVHELWSSTLFWGRSGAGVAALSAIENALWDLKGKELGVPVHTLLGGPTASKLPIYASGGLDAPLKHTAQEMEQLLSDGFKAIKIRIGQGAKKDLEKVRLVRKVIGPDISLMVDAVMGHHPTPWTASEAIHVAKAISEFDITWFEEPCAAYNYEGYAEVRRFGYVPVSGGESACKTHEFNHFFRAGALDVVQPDAVHCGGISELLKIAALANVHGVRVAPHSWGSAATLMANYHAAFACSDIFMVEYPTFDNPLRHEMLIEPLQMNNGFLSPPMLPGLGIQLTDEIIERYPFRRHV